MDFDLFKSFNWHFNKVLVQFKYTLLKNTLNLVDLLENMLILIKNRSKWTENQNLISTPDFKADRFCHSKLLESDVKSSMIQFEMAICLSLPLSHCTKEVGLKFSSFLNIDGKKLNSTQKLFETKFYKYTSSSFGITYFFWQKIHFLTKMFPKRIPPIFGFLFLATFYGSSTNLIIKLITHSN